MASIGAFPATRTIRRVDWLVVFGPDWRATFRRKSAHGVVSVLSAADELVSYRDTAQIHQRSVELARDRLELDRVALFLLQGDGQLHGTFGTLARASGPANDGSATAGTC